MGSHICGLQSSTSLDICLGDVPEALRPKKDMPLPSIPLRCMLGCHDTPCGLSFSQVFGELGAGHLYLFAAGKVFYRELICVHFILAHDNDEPRAGFFRNFKRFFQAEALIAQVGANALTA